MVQQLYKSLRKGQQRIADWQGGALAVSAVPGSGKSTGMAIATAILLARRYLQDAPGVRNQESGVSFAPIPVPFRSQLILVTFTRSAAANLKLKIRHCLKELALPFQGFAVYTLHGLALAIARQHPDLSALDPDQLTLVSPNQSNRLIRDVVEQWIVENPHVYNQLLAGQQFDGEETERLRRQSVLRTEVLPELANTIIREAKSSGLSPEALANLGLEGQVDLSAVDASYADYPVLAIAAGLYANYERLLHQRNWMDYDDMILAALRVLENADARHLWQSQVGAVFEDEAQDSSPLQTKLLKLLASHPDQPDLDANLVRVGDPNQAINSTFTPADPVFFRRFCEDCAQRGNLAQMDQSGRSAAIIIHAANSMLEWVNRQFQYSESTQPFAAEQPFRPQTIHLVDSDDPQADANPDPVGGGVEIHYPPEIEKTVELIGQRVTTLWHQYPEGRFAILVRETRQGKFIADRLRYPATYSLAVDLGEMPIYEVGQSDRQSQIPAEILALLQFLDRPHSPDNLKAALQVLVDRQLIPTQDLNSLAAFPEQFLYPGPLDPVPLAPVLVAQQFCAHLLNARLELPLFQLIPFLALNLNYEQSELATADKLAARIAQQIAHHQSMTAVLEVLGELVRSERFDPVETDDPDARYTRPGQLTIITMHKAKGLDWDFVFLPFLHETVIPGRSWIPPQRQFLGDVNLAEVTRAQIRAHVHGEAILPDLITAWERAKHLKKAEEYHLLYVAMTRARRLLWMSAARQAPFTWSKPENLEDRAPCPVLPVLGDRLSNFTHYGSR
jgi:DNA helicase-2/ATP-dependent DNA helicase PcrA